MAVAGKLLIQDIDYILVSKTKTKTMAMTEKRKTRWPWQVSFILSSVTKKETKVETIKKQRQDKMRQTGRCGR